MKADVELYQQLHCCAFEAGLSSYRSVQNAAIWTLPTLTSRRWVILKIHAGLIYDALIIFNKMVEDDKIRPSQEHYGCIIDLFARAGCLSDASAFVSQLGIGPSAWRALFSGCVLHVGRFQDAEALRLGMQKKALIKNP
ncbi:hypothetical protein REPUB_Repub01dG0229700 [Reevesia pubescens]